MVEKENIEILLNAPKFQTFLCPKCKTKKHGKKAEVNLECNNCGHRFRITDLEFDHIFYGTVDRTLKKIFKAFTYGVEFIDKEGNLVVERVDSLNVVCPEMFERDLIELKYLLENNRFNVSKVEKKVVEEKVKVCKKCAFCMDCFTCSKCSHSGFNDKRCPKCNSKEIKRTHFVIGKKKECLKCKSKNIRNTTVMVELKKCNKCGSEEFIKKNLLNFKINVKKTWL